MSNENDVTSPDPSPRHAGVWVRVAANLIDAIVFGVPLLLLGTALLGSEPASDEAASIADLYDAQFFVNLVIFGVITILLWVNWDGRTPGKKLLSIRITTYPSYNTLSYTTATVRTLLSLTGALSLLAGYVVMAAMVGLRSDKRGYHDLVAKTCVVHDR